mgnify:CR=1 FL=1
MRMQNQLKERLKKLNCLYEVIRLINHPVISINEILEGVTELIPSAMRYPRLAGTRLIFGNESHESPNFKETPWKISQNALIHDKHFEIITCYREEKEFREEEVELLKKIAHQLKSLLDFKLEWI